MGFATVIKSQSYKTRMMKLSVKLYRKGQVQKKKKKKKRKLSAKLSTFILMLLIVTVLHYTFFFKRKIFIKSFIRKLASKAQKP